MWNKILAILAEHFYNVCTILLKYLHQRALNTYVCVAQYGSVGLLNGVVGFKFVENKTQLTTDS